MPIHFRTFRPLSRDAFGKLFYKVFGDVLALRQELGKCFDAKHYKRALGIRRTDLLLDEPVEVVHDTFRKTYFLDVVMDSGGLMEFEAAESVTPRHRMQLLHFLMLTELTHGVLVNVKPERVSHEFVNNVLSHRDRQQFEVTSFDWRPDAPGAALLSETLIGLLRDWGTALDANLYVEALTHFLGGEDKVVRPASVTLNRQSLGTQLLRFAAPRVAFKLTSLEHANDQAEFRSHLRKFVDHLDIDALLWANVGRHEIQLHCIER